MGNTRVYTYGIANAILVILGSLLFLGVFVYVLIYEKRTSNLLLAGAFAIAACVILYFITIKELIPFINRAPALTFNEVEIIDHRNNFSIKWLDIEGIQLNQSRRGRDLILTLKSPITQKHKICISLGHIQGDGNEIYYTAQNFLKTVAGSR